MTHPPRALILLVVCVAMIAHVPAGFAQEGPVDILHEYIESLIRADWPAAERLWDSTEVARSNRLGIRFDSVSAKYDCASPLFGALDAVRAGIVTYEIEPGAGNSDTWRTNVVLRDSRDSIRSPYNLIRTDAGWKLCSPLHAARGWPRHETRFARVICRDSTLLNQSALDDLDRYIEATARALGCQESSLVRLSDAKLDYYLGDETDMLALTGFPVHGMTSVPLDVVVSRHLPHYHEITHALVNFALSPLPLHTLPLMQEGLAVSFGGRWEKSPDVLFELGAFMIEEDFGSLDDVLTYSAFHAPGADLDANYAISGLFVEYLRERYGLAKVLACYRRLSGTSEIVQSWDGGDVRTLLSDAFGESWPVMESEFQGFCSQHRLGGIQPGGTNPTVTPMLRLRADSVVASIWEEDSVYVFVISTRSENAEGVLLLNERPAAKSSPYRSRMFPKHLPGHAYQGARFGIAFSTAEVGLYDYLTDNLLEKFVTGIHPGEGYWDASNRSIHFRLYKSALPAPLALFDLELAIP